MSYLAEIDLDTLNTKAMVIASSGHILTIRCQKYRSDISANRYAGQNPDVWRKVGLYLIPWFNASASSERRGRIKRMYIINLSVLERQGSENP
jgi:hypothetical protein